MTLFDRINEDIKLAMKAREKVRLEALRNVKKLILEQRADKGAGSELTDGEILKIIQKLVKQGKDSAVIYSQQNRSDLADDELRQVEALEGYLPAQMSAEEMEEVVKRLINETGAQTIKEMGKVMGLATKELSGKADGRLIADTVKKLLSK